MVAAVQSLRLCARACSRAPAPRRIAPQFVHSTRTFSSTRARRADEHDAPTKTEDQSAKATTSKAPQKVAGKRSDKVVLGLQEGMNEDEKEAFRALLQYADHKKIGLPARWTQRKSDQDLEAQAERLEEHMAGATVLSAEEDEAFKDLDRAFNSLDEVASEINQNPKINKRSFWGEDEEDPDYLTEDIDEDDFSDEDIMSLAHGKLEEHREFREYARIAAWQMPLLNKLARPFEPPTKEECLRFRYTTYMGENHPAQSKVVVEFSTKDLPLNGKQAQKLWKLLGPRWNPETKVAKMSCEQFDHQAQNKRYLADLVNKLIAEAKDTTDTFEDVPLDTRHHQKVVKPKFPKEWYLTEARVQQLEDQRQNALLLDQSKEDAGSLVDGDEIVVRHFKQPEMAAIPAFNRAPSLFPGKPGPKPRRMA
ncbi:mitochondrial ribosomal subunit protein-domain-containing protein [Truncatella angustata]|uniref:Mitochondrial ribosomal subunit protein-domain-containing protein n=1 Tax=Truncatella angustata TaxID=152316 RepID=A0A9P8ZYT2_9PEZI|nr:mitochondrial ribosomal subunit protein-domain-containing protein [Truncatella angustata]KAH6655492.1 mitochondrial ribosomal subunit protein-domain-containing protein [Truncatella angustata]KAH8199693.1 hypothetical protein TruAng_006162 [Truncatella angustata]